MVKISGIQPLSGTGTLSQEENTARKIAQKVRYKRNLDITLKPERPQTGDPIRCRTHEQTPLGQEVCDEDEIVAVWYGFDKAVPCKDEVGKHKENRTDCINTAPLQERAQEHKRNQDCIHAASDAFHTMWRLRNNLRERDRKQSGDTDEQHGQVALCACGELSVMFDLCKIALHKEPDIKSMSYSKESHLCYEIAACAEPVAEGGKEQSSTDLPWGQSKRSDKKRCHRKYQFMRDWYRQEKQHCKYKKHSGCCQGSGFRCHRR